MVYKKPTSKYWYCKFELQFQNIRKKIHKSTRLTSKAKAEAFEAQLKQKVWQALTTPAPEHHLFKEALALYIESRQANRTIKEKETKLNWWSTNLRNPVLANLSTQEILSAISKKRSVAIATRNRYLAELKAFLNFCHQELGWIEKVPVLKILKEPKRAFYKLSKEDIKQLLAASPAYLRPVIAFALMTGLRRSNIFGLRWAQIDFNNECVYIAGAEHKSKDHVNTPLSQQALTLLLHLKTNSSSPFVFLNTRNNQVAKISDDMWKRITKTALLDGLRFHDLRHNWATKHIEAGTDLLALKELGGWKTLEMVQRYSHPSNEYLAQQAKNIDHKQQLDDVFEEQYNSEVIEVENTSNDSNKKLICGKKSSHLAVTETIFDDLVIISEAHKAKNLLIISRLDVWYRKTDLNRHARRQRILNPSCLPIPPLRRHSDLQIMKNIIEVAGIIRKKCSRATVFFISKLSCR